MSSSHSLATNQALRVEDCVDWVHGHLILSGVTDQALCVCEGNERGRRAVALVVRDDFDSVISEDANAAVRRSQVDT